MISTASNFRFMLFFYFAKSKSIINFVLQSYDCGHIKKRRYAYLVSREPRKFKDIAQGLHNRSHAYLRGLFIHIRAHRFS